MASPLELSDRYQIEKTLGKGAVGVAYLCFDKTLDTRVTVKVLKDTAREKDFARFHVEAKLAAKLNHPNVVQVYDFGQADNGQAYLVMQFCPGRNLKELLDENSELSQIEVLKILKDIAAGLAHAHERQILHRDIKPSNIILSEDEEGNSIARLADFGLAKMMLDGENQFLTSTGSIIGTPAYMSPEVASNKEVLFASDVFSFGCVAYEMLTGSAPHKKDTAIATINSRASELAPPINSVSDREFHPSLEKLVSKCLAIDPENRYKDGTQLLQAVRETIGEIENQSEPVIQLSIDEPDKTEDKTLLWKIVGSFILTGVITVVIAWQILASLDREEEKRKVSSPPLEISKPNKLYDVGSEAINHHEVRKKLYEGIEWYDIYGMNTAEHLSLVKGRHDIKYLTMSSDDLRGKGFEILLPMNLEGLSLTDCTIGDANLSLIGKMQGLRILNLFTSQGFKESSLLTALNTRTLVELNIGDTIASDAVIENVKEMKSLSRLSLELCKNFTGKTIDKLKVLKGLRRLDLADSGFDKKFLPVLSRLSGLKALDISSLNLTDSDLEPIYKMPLVELNVDRNQLSDKALLKIARMKSLKKLCLEKNKNLSTGAVEKFKALRKDCALIEKQPRTFESQIPFAE